MTRSVLIYNPKSGRQASGRLLEEVRELLSTGGFVVDARPTRGPGDATILAREAVAEGVEVAFAMGGDGTMREVAAGLLGSEVALGALPAGTANVLSIALGIPKAALGAAQLFRRGWRIDEIDVGWAGEEPFLMMVSGGLDAAVMTHQDAELKKRFGRLGIAGSALKAWWSYDFPEVCVRVAGTEHRASFFAVCNIPFYGGGFRMAPDADPHDGELDVVLFRGGRGAMLGFARDIALQRHHRRRDVEILRARELEILPSPVSIQIDGDVPGLRPPFQVRVGNERLRVLVAK